MTQNETPVKQNEPDESKDMTETIKSRLLDIYKISKEFDIVVDELQDTTDKISGRSENSDSPDKDPEAADISEEPIVQILNEIRIILNDNFEKCHNLANRINRSIC